MSIAYRIADWWLRDKGAEKRQEVVKEDRRKEDMRIVELLDRLEYQDKQIREQLDLYETLLNGVPVIIWYIEGIDRMGLCNKTCAEFFGLETPDQLVGTSLYELMPEEEAALCVKHNRRVFEKYETVESEEWVTRHDGERRLWQITKTPRGNGHVEYAVCCGVDITERREAEQYRDALLKALPDLVFVHDTDGNYLDCYAPDDDMLTMPCEMVIGKHISDCFDPEMTQTILETYKRIMVTRQMEVLEYKLAVSGEERDFEARIVPLNGDKMLSTVRDVTDWKQAQERLAKQLTWQQEALRRCEDADGCPGREDGTCRKATTIGLDSPRVGYKDPAVRGLVEEMAI